MQGGTFITAGSGRADDGDRFASAPHGQLLDKNALTNVDDFLVRPKSLYFWVMPGVHSPSNKCSRSKA